MAGTAAGEETGAVDELNIPELVMLFATDLAALDHHEGAVTLIANAVNWDASDERVDDAYFDAVARLHAMSERLASPTSLPAAVFTQQQPSCQPANLVDRLPGHGRGRQGAHQGR